MAARLRKLARRVLGVERVPTYYLPWLTRPGLACALLVNNVESRFTSGRAPGPYTATVTQHDADGRVVATTQAVLAGSTDTCEVPLSATAAGVGFVTVASETIRSDLYVTLSSGEAYTVTHGRHEFIECYPPWTRAGMAVAGAALGVLGRTIPAFRRDQYVYRRSDSRSHLLVMNLSTVTNRVRIVAHRGGRRAGARLFTLPARGSRLVDVVGLAPAPASGTAVDHLRLTGNAWFNLYLVGAGPRDLDGALSLMHVK